MTFTLDSNQQCEIVVSKLPLGKYVLKVSDEDGATWNGVFIKY